MPTASELPKAMSSPLWRVILAPTDFSERSKAAVQTAIRLAEQCGGQITLLHVVQPSPANAFDAGVAVDELLNSSRECMEDLARGIPPELVQDKLVRFAARGTVQEVISVAQDISADVMVIATHGYGLLKRVLLGGTAEYLVRHAPCPVLVVRSKAGRGTVRMGKPSLTESGFPGQNLQPPSA